MLVCFDCWNIYNAQSLRESSEYCPIEGCDGRLIEIDENLIPTIQTLNDKGYFTTFCCSGHPWGSIHVPGSASAYISFEPDIEKSEFAELPKGWDFDKDSKKGLVIRARYVDCDPISLQQKILDGIKEIAKWADGLPSRED